MLEKKEDPPYTVVKVTYTREDPAKDFSKYLDLWSPAIREPQKINDSLAQYKKGTRVMVWSNSKQAYIEGVVIQVLPQYQAVDVRYADHQKIVPLNSNQLRLLDANEINNTNNNSIIQNEGGTGISNNINYNSNMRQGSVGGAVRGNSVATRGYGVSTTVGPGPNSNVTQGTRSIQQMGQSVLNMGARN